MKNVVTNISVLSKYVKGMADVVRNYGYERE
jgi:hypothetical protein